MMLVTKKANQIDSLFLWGEAEQKGVFYAPFHTYSLEIFSTLLRSPCFTFRR